MAKKIISFLIIIVLTFSFFTVSAEELAYVNCNLLNVRVSPTTESGIVTQLPCGSKVEIIYADLGWYNIRMENGVTGFVSAPYITKAQISVGDTASIGAKVASNAYNYIGYSYVYGTAGPNTFDCSGFTSYLYKQYGISLPRTSYSQGSYGTYVEKSQLIPGDIVCFSNRSDKRINHVGVYVGNGQFIHASTSTRGVVIDSLSEKYYVNHYVTARRVV